MKTEGYTILLNAVWAVTKQESRSEGHVSYYSEILIFNR